MSFETFWSMYPRKIAKGAALKAWLKLKPLDQQLAIDALPNHVKHWEIKQTEKEYIPHCSTWLNGWRWLDEIDLTPKKEKQDMSWMVTNEGIEKKARELNVLGNGYDTYYTLKQKCLQKMGINLQ
jgi:hypothetical protein